MLEALFTPEIKTFLIAMLPVGELRAAIPIALTVYRLPVYEAVFLSILGNFIPAALLVYFLGPVSDFFSRRSKPLPKFLHWIFEYTRHRHSKRFDVLGAIALITFIGIPLPVTGAWTGSIMAFLFGFDKRKSIWYVLLGILLSAAIVTPVTMGLINIF